MRSALSALALVLVLGAAADARAQSIIRDRSPHSRPLDISLLGGLPYPFGFGAGFRVGIPIAPNGFIGKLNDAVFLEPGVQFVYWDDFHHTRTGVMVPILMRWDFFLTRAWTLYGSVGVVFGFFTDDEDRFRVRDARDIFYPSRRPGFFQVAFGGGAMWNFSPNTSLRLDASTQMLAIGVVFRL